MVLIPHPDKPTEPDEILDHLHKLGLCKNVGGWDLKALDKWLELYPDLIARAAERLDEVLDDIYKPKEV